MEAGKGSVGTRWEGGGWEQVWDTQSRKKQDGKEPTGIQLGDTPSPLLENCDLLWL